MAESSHIYWDESSIFTEDYLGIGAVTLDRECAEMFADSMKAIRRNTIMHKREFKWRNLCNRSYPIYEEVCELAFRLMEAGRLSFACMTLEKSRIDFDNYHRGNMHLAWDKFAHTLIMWKCVPAIPTGMEICVFPDKKSDLSTSDSLIAFNRSILSKYWYQRNHVTQVTQVDSTKTQIGQLNDVLLGAVMYRWNRHHLKDIAKIPKVNLSARIAELARIPDLVHDSGFGVKPFTIWPFDFDRAHKKSPPIPSSESAATPNQIR